MTVDCISVSLIIKGPYQYAAGSFDSLTEEHRGKQIFWLIDQPLKHMAPSCGTHFDRDSALFNAGFATAAGTPWFATEKNGGGECDQNLAHTGHCSRVASQQSADNCIDELVRGLL
jgi:hypothetical protein